MKNTSWKTSLIGCILAVVVAVAPILQTGVIDWKAVVIGALLAIAGFLQKDANVTGGNVSNKLTVPPALKTLALIFLLSGVGLACSAQGSSTPFFKPVPKDLFKTEKIGLNAAVTPTSVWLFRPSVEISAIEMVYNKTTKEFESEPLNSAGVGLSYQHYVSNEGTPFNDFGFNALVLLGTDIENFSPASVSLAGTVNYNVINIGGGYNFGQKVPFILTGITLKF